jgi:hypothetical protein
MNDEENIARILWETGNRASTWDEVVNHKSIISEQMANFYRSQARAILAAGYHL